MRFNQIKTWMEDLVPKIPLIGIAALGVMRAYRRLIGPWLLRRRLRLSPDRRIVVGASGVFQDGWIPTGIEYLNMLECSDWDRFFDRDSIDAILAEHVWEHLSPTEGIQAASSCFRYLKPGGYVRVAVPDGLNPDPDYIERVKIGGSGRGAHDHRTLYTHHTLADAFQRAGFETVLYEFFDDSGQFHFREWSRKDGMVWRSKRFDERNRTGVLNYTSIIMDAAKPKVESKSSNPGL